MKQHLVMLVVASVVLLAASARADSQIGTGMGVVDGAGRRDAIETAKTRAAEEAVYLAVEKVLHLSLTRTELETGFEDMLFDARRYARIVGEPEENDGMITCSVAVEYEKEAIQARAAEMGLFDDALADANLNCLVYVPETAVDHARSYWYERPAVSAAETGLESALQEAGVSTFRGQARPTGPDSGEIGLVYQMDAWGRVVTTVLASRYWEPRDDYGYESFARDVNEGRYEDAYSRLLKQGIDIVVMGSARAEVVRDSGSGRASARAVVETHAFTADSKRGIVSRVEHAGASDLSPDVAISLALSEAGRKAGAAVAAKLMERVQQQRGTNVRVTFANLNARQIAAARKQIEALDGVRYVTTKGVLDRRVVLEVRYSKATTDLSASLAGKVLDELGGYLSVESSGPETVVVRLHGFEEDDPRN